MRTLRPPLFCGLLGITLCLSACDAHTFYQSLADGGSRIPDLNQPVVFDLATPDGGGSDGSGGATGDLAQSGERTLFRGTFEDRAGHIGRGDGTIVRLATGALELRMAANFAVSGVPGPFVFISSRADMGTRIDTNLDLELGRLKANSGAQTYPLPQGDYASKPYVFVFCKPFGVEVARAVMRPAP